MQHLLQSKWLHKKTKTLLNENFKKSIVRRNIRRNINQIKKNLDGLKNNCNVNAKIMMVKFRKKYLLKFSNSDTRIALYYKFRALDKTIYV